MNVIIQITHVIRLSPMPS